jgi:transposase
VLAFFAQLPECLVGMEACGLAHHWARELIKLGHDARMMPPAYVKPYVRRQKNDAADAAGIRVRWLGNPVLPSEGLPIRLRSIFLSSLCSTPPVA